MCNNTVRTVQKLLGHSNISTTMRYLHFVQDQATPTVLAAQRREREGLGTNLRSTDGQPTQICVSDMRGKGCRLVPERGCEEGSRG